MLDAAIQTDKLTRTFGSIRAVDQLTLAVPAGSVYGLIGPSGSGKSTTIRLLLGLLAPTSGSATVLGYDTVTGADQIRLHTGAVLDYSGLYTRLSALDNLDFYGRIWHMPPTERRTRAAELLHHLDLWDRRHEIVETWSRGMQQRLAIARAIFHHPSLVCMDEPTARLDPIEVASVRQDLADLSAREGITFFLATNNLVVAETICTHVAVIQHGKLLAAGPVHDLRSTAGHSHVAIRGRGFTPPVISLLARRPDVVSVAATADGLTIELAPNSDIAPLVSLLVESSVDIEEVHRPSDSLASTFVNLLNGEAAL